MIDIVTVPDFSGPSARRFELMTLFFLASWAEACDPSKDVTLHIAAIGEIPESVLRLAGRCGVRVTRHSPVHGNNCINKLRGFEVNRSHDYLFLVDTDVFLLSDLSDLPKRLAENCISAAYANSSPITDNLWMTIYSTVDVPVPSTRMLPVNVSLDTYGRGLRSDVARCLPYFNAGVVCCPWDCNLQETWLRHYEKISRSDIVFDPPGLLLSDQPAFVTAVAELKDKIDFRRLPDIYHVRWQHLTTGTVRLKSARLYHAIGFLKHNVDLEICNEIEAVDIYFSKLMKHVNRVHFHKTRGASKFVKKATHLRHWSRRNDALELHKYVCRLYEHYVRDLLK